MIYKGVKIIADNEGQTNLAIHLLDMDLISEGIDVKSIEMYKGGNIIQLVDETTFHAFYDGAEEEFSTVEQCKNYIDSMF